jgi:hypothetical protein
LWALGVLSNHAAKTNRRTSRHLQIKLRDVRMDHYEALLA